MRKSNIVSGCLFAVLAGVLLWQASGESNPAKDKLYDEFAAWLDQRAFANHELDERRLGLARFLNESFEVEAEFAADRLTLEEAVTRILAAAVEHYPEHLDWMIRFEKGNTPEERIARNFARHFEEDEELSQNQELCERLRTQLAELLKKYQKTLPMLGAMAA